AAPDHLFQGLLPIGELRPVPARRLKPRETCIVALPECLPMSLCGAAEAGQGDDVVHDRPVISEMHVQCGRSWCCVTWQVIGEGDHLPMISRWNGELSWIASEALTPRI